MTNFNVNPNSATFTNSVSDETRIQKFYYHKASETIIVFDTEGRKRLCRVKNFDNVNDARELWKDIKAAFLLGDTVRFIARGNNSANDWFFQIETV